MAVDRIKILENAQKHLGKGNYQKAIREYQKLVREDPSDVRTLLKIGDVHIKAGAQQEAIHTYRGVAEQYSKQGFYLKAVAVFKNIIKITPESIETRLRLADMYVELQRLPDAVAIYEEAANHYMTQGHVDLALQALQRIVEFDAENLPARIKFAEALSRAGRSEEAANEFAEGASLLRAAGRLDDYAKVAERLLFHRPDDAHTARQLSRYYLQRGDAKRALAKLQICFKHDPHDVETLQLLARSFDILGQTSKTISVLRELARVFLERGRNEDRARTLRKILELSPNDVAARQALAGYAPSDIRADVISPPSSAVVGSGSRPLPEIQADPPIAEPEGEIELLDSDLLMDAEVDVEFEESPDTAAPVMAEPAQEKPDLDSATAREARIARLLTECEVFERYGLQERVIEQLNLVLEIDPHHIPTRERLKDLFLGMGDVTQAIQQLEALRDLFGPGKPHLARLYQDQVNALRSQPPAAPADDALIFIEESAADIDLGHDAAPITHVDPPVDAESPFSPPSSGSDTDEQPVIPLDAAHAEQARADAEAAARAAEAPAEIEDSLEEADFFITQGLLGEARTTLEDALEQNPGHILLREKLAEVGLLENQRKPTEVVSLSEDSQLIRQTLVETVGDVDDAFQDGSDIIDVGEVLGSLSENAPASPEDGPGNHLELGIAYKEMGLLDDAISEFENAAQQPEMACTALTMIGQCMVEKGEIDNAIARFKEALNIENLQPRDELTLYHALGMVYERAGNVRESRFYYEYVVKRDPTFRDVQARLAQLEEGSGSDANASSSDSVETNFNNLMRDQDG